MELRTALKLISGFWLPLWLALVTSFYSAAVQSAANCEQLAASLQSQRQAIKYLQQQKQALDQLKSGQLDPDFTLSQAFNFSFTDRISVGQAIARVEADTEIEAEPPAAFSNCPDETEAWRNLQRQMSSLTQVVQSRSLELLKLPRSNRLTLAREIQQWETLYQLEQEIQTWNKSVTSSQATTLTNAIIDWIDYWRGSMQIWLAQLTHTGKISSPSNQIWFNTLQVPNPASAIPWKTVEQLSVDEQPEALHIWQHQLDQSHAALIREASIWRNQQIWKSGWGKFFADLTKPNLFWQHLWFELRFAPINIVDSISRPLIRTYYQELKKGQRGELISSWFMQSVLLVALLSGLLRVASYAPAQLSKLQRASLGQLDHRTLSLLKNAAYWFLKPNAPWLVALFGSQLCANLAPENWIIFKLIGPIGAIYAAHQAIRVIIEWLLSRTYTRTEQFVSSHTATAQTKDSRTLAWVWLCGSLVVYIISTAGGGYLLFISLMLWAALIWFSFFVLMLRYPDGIARFLLYVAGQGKSRKQEPVAAQRWWLKALWPLLYALAHLVDLARSAHQKLLAFDAYRAFSIRVIRMRLAAEQKDEESSETKTDDEPPDLTYGEWMLREEDAPWIEVVGLEKVTAPIKHWAGGNPDDNVLLVVGDQGSGKSALIHHMCDYWKDHPISILKIPGKTTDPSAVFPLIANHLDLPQISSIAELVKHEEELEPQIVIIEDAQNLFMSEVGKLDAYRALNQCLNAHLTKLFWIVVMHSHSWTYLNCVFSRELRFSNIFSMPRWSPADIRKLILSRHQGSRRRLSYNELLLSASAGNDSSSVRAANSRVFNILWEQSGGIPKVAIHLWLNAAKSKERQVEIGVPEKPQSSQFKGVSDDLCFIYAAIFTHHDLNSEEIMEVTHYPETIVRHALKQAAYRGMILRDANKRYRIHPLWQGTLFNVLASRNMLWT